MTNREMMEIAMRQSAEDMGCHVEDFKADKNVVVPINLGKKARKYLKEPITCNLVSYGNNIMAASIPETMDLVSAYVDKFEFYHCFETPNMHWLNERLAEKGHKICFMAEYYLPDISRIPTLSCAYVTRVLTQEAFADLYRPEWSNALCEDRKNLDVLGVGAYDGSTLVGLAACSADLNAVFKNVSFNHVRRVQVAHVTSVYFSLYGLASKFWSANKKASFPFTERTRHLIGSFVELLL